MLITISEIKKYIENTYQVEEITVLDDTDKNQILDVQCMKNSFHMTLEIKERFFTNSYFLQKEDILFELVQHWYIFGNVINNKNVNSLDANKINTGIGWFYKCNADRLLYFRHFNNTPYDLIDIDFKLFKNWILDRMGDFSLQYSSKTTKTVNLVVPIHSIPHTMYNHTFEIGW